MLRRTSKNITNVTLRIVIFCLQKRTMLTYWNNKLILSAMCLRTQASNLDDDEVIENLIVKAYADVFRDIEMDYVKLTTMTPDEDKSTLCAFVYVTPRDPENNKILSVKNDNYIWANLPKSSDDCEVVASFEGKTIRITENYARFALEAIRTCETEIDSC